MTTVFYSKCDCCCVDSIAKASERQRWCHRQFIHCTEYFSLYHRSESAAHRTTKTWKRFIFIVYRRLLLLTLSILYSLHPSAHKIQNTNTKCELKERRKKTQPTYLFILCFGCRMSLLLLQHSIRPSLFWLGFVFRCRRYRSLCSCRNRIFFFKITFHCKQTVEPQHSMVAEIKTKTIPRIANIHVILHQQRTLIDYFNKFPFVVRRIRMTSVRKEFPIKFISFRVARRLKVHWCHLMLSMSRNLRFNSQTQVLSSISDMKIVIHSNRLPHAIVEWRGQIHFRLKMMFSIFTNKKIALTEVLFVFVWRSATNPSSLVKQQSNDFDPLGCWDRHENTTNENKENGRIMVCAIVQLECACELTVLAVLANFGRKNTTQSFVWMSQQWDGRCKWRKW